MNRVLFVFLLFSPFISWSQKKPLDHTVYDSWQSIGEKMISPDGKWVVYTVTPQEGDTELFIKENNTGADRGGYVKVVPRGYSAQFTDNSRFVVFKIKPLFSQTREAKIKKKKPEDFPKDSFAVVELGKDSVYKVARVKSFKLPKKASGWLAYQKEKERNKGKGTENPTQKTVDSLRRTIDSLTILVQEIKNKKGGNRDEINADNDGGNSAAEGEGSQLVLRNLETGREWIFEDINEYVFNDLGHKLAMTISASKESANKNAVVLVNLATERVDTVLKKGNDFKKLAISEDGEKLAFVAERDSSTKALQRFYQLYLYEKGRDSAMAVVARNSQGMPAEFTVSENGAVYFSKSGNRLFFGTAPVQKPKDTSLIDIDLVKLDIWHYKDDYLQTQQLFNLQNELKRSYLAVYHLQQHTMVQLGSKGLPNITPTDDGEGKYFLAVTDTGRRIQTQWAGQTLRDVYAVEVTTGEKVLIKRNHIGTAYLSSTGKNVLLFDSKAKHYFLWDGKTTKNISAKVQVPLYDVEHDTPNEPPAYGIMAWHKEDSFVYVYDQFDVWRLDPAGNKAPLKVTNGRTAKIVYRNIPLDPEKEYLSDNQLLLFRGFHKETKEMGLHHFIVNKEKEWFSHPLIPGGQYNYAFATRAKQAPSYLFTRENYQSSPDLFLLNFNESQLWDEDYLSFYQSKGRLKRVNPLQLSTLNKQQSGYNWGTAELYKWKTFTGKESTGILYKPEDFDSTKKYPVIIYFYEKLSDGLNNYIAPEPTRSRLNIPFFVSRGYLVFAPDISYTRGNPGKDAYNYIVSGAQSLARKSWVDSKNMAIQGQSWGGYQVAHLITRTNMFKAAWAGAPVANMTSAYGGIRWESGVNRQFQYEKGQSRIGASLWERTDLYIENSPLFHLPKVNTPIVIMANDADGAVPWYQGIELFTALRRLGKQVWMLNYNGEAHNLVERKNKKDIQIRQQQYFDWLLKGEKPAKWITDGVPAVDKGKDWGLEIVH